MDETTLNANTSNEITATQQSAMATPPPPPAAASTETAASEHRQAYGTAKTENLRDSGLWRFLLPASVIVGCVALLAVPLLILVPLLINSLDASSHTYGLVWLWITMTLLEVGVAGLIIWGLTKIFLTQAGNYRR
ncbi:MAG TPA: hypothetical protein VFK47_04920 [Ktedonobacteraceae bacterium]|nr:hypothetical protein [Ktedonobacteraceae bacterium]